jgi:hypothetical protein
MNMHIPVYVITFTFLTIYFPANAQVTEVIDSKYKSIRECNYVGGGVILRLPSERECPTLKIDAPTPIVPNAVAANAEQPQTVSRDQMTQGANAKTSDDIILDKAIYRCTNIGYKRETAEFRSCVTEQITLLSK